MGKNLQNAGFLSGDSGAEDTIVSLFIEIGSLFLDVPILNYLITNQKFLL
jgi:hypothetical protein